MRQPCGNCGGSFSLTFDRCPACGTPAGTKGAGPTAPAKPLPREDDNRREPSEPAPAPPPPAPREVALDLDPGSPPPPPALREVALDLDPGSPPPPQPHSTIPSLDLSDLPQRLPGPLLDLAPPAEQAPAEQASVEAPPASHADDAPLPAPPRAPFIPDASLDAARDEGATRSEQPAPPFRVPTRSAAPAIGGLLAAQRPGSDRPGRSSAVLLARILVAIGVACIALALLPLGCWRLLHSSAKVEVKDLASVRAGKRVQLVDGVADWNDAVVVDADSPTELTGPGELLDRSAALKGKLVGLTAAPFGGYMYKQYRIGSDGKREEISGATRVYLPLTLDNKVWAISRVVPAMSFDDPKLKAELENTRHIGVVQLLSDNVSLDDIRRPEHTSRAPAARSHVPDDALAIVAVQTDGANKKYAVARIAGTQGRYVAVSTGERPGSDQTLYGELHPCPSQTCQSFTATLAVEPAAVLLLIPGQSFPFTGEVVMFLLLGCGCVAAAFALQRRFSG